MLIWPSTDIDDISAVKVRSVTTKTVVLVTLTLSATAIMIFGYTHVSRMLGIGRTNLTTYIPSAVTVYLAAGGGLHPGSPVTEHGKPIGKVTAVEFSPRGLEVALSVDGDVKMGADATATIQHPSPVEQMSLELTSDQADGPYLSDGTAIPPTYTTMPELSPLRLVSVTD